jgi:HicB family
MSTLSLRLPNSIHQSAKIFAEREGISINQLAATALAEKLAALATESFINERAARSSNTAFASALASVPANAPDAEDVYEAAPVQTTRRGKRRK